MSNSTTPNEPPYPPCTRSNCDCSNCLNFRAAAEAAARTPETAISASEYCTRELDKIFAAERARFGADSEEAARLRTYLKDCRCPCCDARARLRAISYDRAEHSPAAVHCETSDRRDNNADSARAEAERRFIACLVREFTEALTTGLEAIRPAATRYHETDTNAR